VATREPAYYIVGNVLRQSVAGVEQAAGVSFGSPSELFNQLAVSCLADIDTDGQHPPDASFNRTPMFGSLF
jgi:hypothetical protein